MNFIRQVADFILHIDRHLQTLIGEYGGLVYAILFLIVFCETGLVVTPFLPGDSLLFAAGALAAAPGKPLDLYLLFVVLFTASMIGDNTNYAVGHFLGRRLFRQGRLRFLNPRHLERTHAFYEKHGGKTLILGKFVPIIRTFAPFVAGLGKMTYPRFFLFNIAAGFIWVTIGLLAGYVFGNFPFVKNNFSLVILGIIVVSLIPAVVELLRHRAMARKEAPPGAV